MPKSNENLIIGPGKVGDNRRIYPNEIFITYGRTGIPVPQDKWPESFIELEKITPKSNDKAGIAALLAYLRSIFGIIK